MHCNLYYTDTRVQWFGFERVCLYSLSSIINQRIGKYVHLRWVQDKVLDFLYLISKSLTHYYSWYTVRNAGTIFFFIGMKCYRMILINNEVWSKLRKITAVSHRLRILNNLLLLYQTDQPTFKTSLKTKWVSHACNQTTTAHLTICFILCTT